MSSSGDNTLSVEEVEKALTEIENKYSLIKSNKTDRFEENLTVLSKEFDSVGLPPIDFSVSSTNLFKQVISGARSLVQIHRRTLSQLKDVNVDNRYKESKSTDLYKTIEGYKLKLTKCEEVNSNLQSKIFKLTNNHAETTKREQALKEEVQKTKRYYLAKENQLQHHIKKLTKENIQLKEALGKDISKYKSKDDVVLKLLTQYKGNEEIYKSTIQQLQANNNDLLQEILDLHEEKTLSDNEQKCT